jgi:hypothetical protein
MNIEKLRELSNDYHCPGQVHICFRKLGIEGKWLQQSLDNDEWLYYCLDTNSFKYSANIETDRAYLLILAVHKHCDDVEKFDMDAYRARFKRRPILNPKEEYLNHDNH